MSIACCLLFIPCSLLLATLWETDSLEEFRKGEFKNVSLTPAPAIQLAPELSRLLETKEMLVLGLAEDGKGDIYAGTGSEGKVLRVRAGAGDELLSLEATQVLCLAADKAGNVYAGTTPGGIIYRITSSKGEEYFNTGQQYVWALAFDDRGALYAGTGDSGLIYRITGKDQGEILYDTPEPHIMCLAWHGALYAGSSGKGLVYRIKDRAAQVLYETDREEVRDLVVEPDGTVYCIANPDPEDASSEDLPGLFRIRPDGNGALLFSPPDSMAFALVRQGRKLLLGTGGKARLYAVNADTAAPDFGAATLLLESKEGQIASLLVTSGNAGTVLFGTGNSGKVYRLESHHAPEGTFESRVFDTGTISRWGRSFWTADTPLGTGLAVSTRTGNSERPDETWSEWEPLRGDVVASRPGRYIQFRVKLSTADGQRTATLSRLTLAYGQTNLPPVIKSVQVKPGEESGRRSLRSITWETSDPNNDSLSFTVYVRGEAEHDWQVIEKDKAGIAKFELDTDRLPDGWYFARLVASDRPGNPLGSELSAEKTSLRFLADNTAPRVGEIAVARAQGKRYRLEFEVKDELSLVAKCEISTNLKDWQAVAPESGIFDAQTERFAVEVELNRGENVIVVRAQDQAGNSGSAKKVVAVD